MSTELFKADPAIITPPDETVDYREQLVGEGKKYKTDADLAKAVVFKDHHITRLEAEAKEMRNEIAARKNLEELAADLATRTAQTPTTPPTSASIEPPTSERERDSITPEEVAKIVDTALSRKEQEATIANNMRIVKRTLQTTLGNDFPEKLRERARQNGLSLTDEELNALAGRDPNSFFKLLDFKPGQEKPMDVFTPPSSSVNTNSFQPTNTTQRTQSYYDKLKMTDKAAYYAPATRKQMYDDAMKLGEAFFDTK